MPKSRAPITFRLSTGGLFYSLSVRAHPFTDNEHWSRRLVILFVALTWLPLIVFSAFEGTLTSDYTGLSLLADLKLHVRCLIVIPLLILAGTIINPIISGTIRGFRESGILADDDRLKFDTALDDLKRRSNSYQPDVVMLVITAALTWAFISGFVDVGFEDDTASWMKTDTGNGAAFTVAGWWYLLVGSPILQIMLYRWFWRFAIWPAPSTLVGQIRTKQVSARACCTPSIRPRWPTTAPPTRTSRACTSFRPASGAMPCRLRCWPYPSCH